MHACVCVRARTRPKIMLSVSVCFSPCVGVCLCSCATSPYLSNGKGSDVLAHFSHQRDAHCCFKFRNPAMPRGRASQFIPFFHLKPIYVVCMWRAAVPRQSCFSAEATAGHQRALSTGPVDVHDDRCHSSVHGPLAGHSIAPGAP